MTSIVDKNPDLTNFPNLKSRVALGWVVEVDNRHYAKVYFLDRWNCHNYIGTSTEDALAGLERYLQSSTAVTFDERKGNPT